MRAYVLAGIPAAPPWSGDWRGTISWRRGRRAGGEAPTLGRQPRQYRNLVTPPWRWHPSLYWILCAAALPPGIFRLTCFSLVAKMADLTAWPFRADTPYPVRWFEFNWNYSTLFFNRGFLKFNYFMIPFTKFFHRLSSSALNLFQI